MLFHMRKIRAEGYHTLSRQTIFFFYEGIDALILRWTVLVKGGEFLKICIHVISFKLIFTLI